jgi:TonB family protein
VAGPQSGVSWRLGECVEQDGMASEWEQGIPACVEATAILPNDRKVVAQIHVGSFRQGLSLTTRFHFAAIENNNQFQRAPRLSDLPRLLSEPFSTKKLNFGALPQISLNGAPRFYTAPAIVGPPKIMRVETVAEIPPPPKPASPKVSKGVTVGNALTKVTPIYPPVARQMNASGEVKVAITIDESGRVIEAKAISGHPALRSAAEEAAKQWVFRPARLDGATMKQQHVLTFIFHPPK